ncbi:class II aldolase/adducin family protein [Microbulbifer sp.]|uniref:class II aldolase/adducin family protein n=1 Tax=Microbulbifer sp. TaxID=1908541 RepID=UPI003F674D62
MIQISVAGTNYSPVENNAITASSVTIHRPERIFQNSDAFRQIILAARPSGMAKLSDFQFVPLAWAGQTAFKFYGRTAVDGHYNGLALDEREGDRIAGVLEDNGILFMKNHGVMVCGPTIAEAWDDLYYLERAADVQIRAMSSGRPLVPAVVAEETARQMREGDPESARLHLESAKRVLDRAEPDYKS